MSEIQLFEVLGHDWRFGVTDSGRPYVVAADVARSFDYASAKDALRLLDEDEKGRQIVPTPGGPQEMLVVFEDGIWELIFRSGKPEAKAIKKRVKTILSEIRKTGRYEVDAEPLDELELAERYATVAQRNVVLVKEKRAAIARAEKAEKFKRDIEGGDTLNLREFHKKYFSAVPERKFFDHLYARGYLIDQRGKGGTSPRTGRIRDGSQHRHPAAKGKPWLYLHTDVDRWGGRHQNTHVRPGEPELNFRDRLASEGLAPNPAPTAPAVLFELEAA